MKSKSGFTIVELLIVIVVIGILAGIVIVGYSGIQERAKAVAIINDLKNTEKALRLYQISSKSSEWWPETSTELTGAANNPDISAIISAQPNFSENLQAPPTTEGLDTANQWYYDNDGDVYDGCSSGNEGVNIAILQPTNTNLMQLIDDLADDGNLACGKIRQSGDRFFYGIVKDATS